MNPIGVMIGGIAATIGATIITRSIPYESTIPKVRRSYQHVTLVGWLVQ
jgi:hypothetical protein